MSKIVYFVRHGRTVANVTGQTQGPDDPLNEVGIKQAGILAERAKNLDFDCIISSDYSRAKVTAETIQAATGKPLTFCELFQEFRRPSEFWGKIPREDPAILAGYVLMHDHFTDADWHFSDEENFSDLKARGIQALQYLLAREEQCLLVVSHGNFLRTLLGLMLRGEAAYAPQDYLDIESTFDIGNTSISVARRMRHWRKNDDTWIIDSWNDYAHLGEME